MKASGQTTVFNAVKDGKAQEVNTGAVIIRDGIVRVAATGEICMEAGAALKVQAGSAKGEYAGIYNRAADSEYALFFGAEDSEGSNARFSLSQQGNVSMKDAKVSGTLDITHDASGETDKDVKFGDGSTFGIAECAALNFLSALGADTIRGFLGYGGGFYIGSDLPVQAVAHPKYGDRYLRLSSSVGYPPYSYSPALSGYKLTSTRQQRRIRTRVTYSYVSGDRGAQPPITSEDGEWQNNGDAVIGTAEAEDGAYAYIGDTAVSEESSPSCFSTDVSALSVGGWTGKRYIKKYYIYRTLSCVTHYAVSSALPQSSGGELDAGRQIAAALFMLQRSAAPYAKYALYAAERQDGQGERRLCGETEASGASFSFSLASALPLLSAGNMRLVIEPLSQGGAVALSDAEVSVSYGGSESVHQEYAYDGSAWQTI